MRCRILLHIAFLFFSIPLWSQTANYFSRQGFELAKLGEYQDALTQYDEAVRLNPRSGAIHYYRGLCQYELEYFDDAIKSFSYALIINTQHSKAYFYRGRAKSKMQLHDEAIVDYNKALEIEPRNPEYLYYRGMSKGSLGLHITAIEDFSLAIKKEPRIGDYYRDRGICWIKLERKDLACEDFTMALELHAFNAGILFGQILSAGLSGRKFSPLNLAGSIVEWSMVHRLGNSYFQFFRKEKTRCFSFPLVFRSLVHNLGLTNCFRSEFQD